MLPHSRKMQTNEVLIYVALIGLGVQTVTARTFAGSPTKAKQSKPGPQTGICYKAECVNTASSTLTKMDQSVEPCDDFYKFACGSFLKNSYIPDGKTGVSAFGEVEDKLRQRLRTIVQKKSTPDDSRVSKLIKTLYNTCMNKSSIEKQGLEPLHKILREFGGWPVLEDDKRIGSNFSWLGSVYKARRMGFSSDLFMSFYLGADPKNNTKKVLGLGQTSGGLPSNFSSKGADNETAKAYLSYMIDVAVILGADRKRAMEEMRESLQFVRNLSNISLPEEKRRNLTALNNMMTVRELENRYPSIPWLEYFNTILAPSVSITEDEPVNVAVPLYFSKLEDLLNKTSKRTLANYAVWRIVQESIPYLSQEIRRPQLDFVTKLTGVTEGPLRWMECISEVFGRFSIGLASLYVKQYFNKEVKNRSEEIVANIREEFEQVVRLVDWMDEDTRNAALNKSKSMRQTIAFPDELLDNEKVEKLYEKIDISPTSSYIETYLNLSRSGEDRYFERLRKPVNQSPWTNGANAAVVNAFYDPSGNSIFIPAGILQGSFFSADRPNYMNYGAIGAIIGHEITHGFDDHGSQFDAEGILKNWWQQPTKAEFHKRMQCIVDQANNYNVTEVSLKLNGNNTQGEIVADNGGFRTAYLAYNELEKREGVEARLPGLQNYTSQQMFWISTAHMWCTVSRPKSLKFQITTDAHPPTEFRVNGVLSNIPEFARDFNCPANSRMNPAKKCIVWGLSKNTG